MIYPDFSSAKILEDIMPIVSSIYADDDLERYKCLEKYASECNIISELGISQGVSLSIMMLTNPKKIIGVDIDIAIWKAGLEALANEYAKRNNIELIILAKDSTSLETVNDVDMLHIDSKHTEEHLRKELNIHANRVKKYIAFHDINQNSKRLLKVIKTFINNNPEWIMEELYEKGKCGHAVIKRK